MPPISTLTPYRPEKPLLPVIGEHTLVRAVGPSHTLARTDALDHLAGTVWRLAHDLEHARAPVSVMEIASRAGLSRGAVILAVTELLRRNRAKVGRPHTVPRGPLDDLRDGLSPLGHFDPDLRSAKILILGAPDLLGRQFVGACSHSRPVTVQESVLEEEVVEETRTYRPRSLVVSMGQVPAGGLPLCLLALPEPQVWDALWPSAARDACGVILVTRPDHVNESASALDLVQSLDLPVQVVLDHPDGTEPDPVAAARALGLTADGVTLADVRSVPSARAALRDLIRQNPTAPAFTVTQDHDRPCHDGRPEEGHSR